MERRTKIELVNLILDAASEPTFSTLEQAAEQEVGQRAIGIYEKLIRRLIIEFPWPFALKRVPLLLSNERPLTTWSYYYHLPNDYGMAWDVYANNPSYVFPSTYDFSIYDGYFSSSYGDSAGVLEGDFLASNMTDLKMYYTHTDSPPEKFPTLFNMVLEYEGGLQLAIRRGMPMDKYEHLKKEYESKKSHAKKLQSVTLPKRRKIGPTQMSTRIMGR